MVRTFAVVECEREMTAKKLCEYGKYRLFECLLISGTLMNQIFPQLVRGKHLLALYKHL